MFKNLLAKKIITVQLDLWTSSLVDWLETRTPRLQNWALAQSDSFSKEDWGKIQFKKLKRLLVRAETNVPYWQKLFKEINLNPKSLRDFEDLQTMPVLTRAEIKTIPTEELINQTAPKKLFVKAFTSGSTGEPLSFYQDRKEMPWRRAGILKELHNFGVVLRRPALILGLSTHKQLDKLGFRFRSADLEIYDQRIKILYPFIYTQKPEVLIGTPSLLSRFVFFLEKDGISMPVFKIIRYTGESMGQGERNAISQKFTCPIFTQYGTRECSYIGMECKEGKLHLTPWINYVEIVDHTGATLPVGRDGRIIVTYFENEVMPFIRYDIGDRGVIRYDPCPCGRQTPTIEFIGRQAGAIKLPSGRTIEVLRIATKIARGFHEEIARFQLEQVSPDTFIFRVIPTTRYSAATELKLLTYFNKIFGGELRCKLRAVEHILPNEDDKTPLFVKRY